MRDVLQFIARLSVPTFIVASMLAMGLRLTPRAILSPLRSPRRVSLALLVNFLLSPAIAYLLTRLLPMQRPHAVGLLLLSLAAGAPFLPKLADAARADPRLTAALMALLTLGTIVFMPLSLPIVVPGASSGAWPIAKPLLTLIALPLVVAMLIRARAGRLAAACQPMLARIGSASLLVLLVLFVGLNLGALWGVVGSGALAIAMLYVAVMFLGGYALEGTTRQAKAACGMAAGARNVGAALPAASIQADPTIIVMLLIGTLAELLVLAAAAAIVRRRTSNGARPQQETSPASASASAPPHPGLTHR